MIKLFEAWTENGKTMIAFNDGDGGVYVMDDDGEFYGDWNSLAGFKGKPNREPIGQGKLLFSQTAKY